MPIVVTLGRVGKYFRRGWMAPGPAGARSMFGTAKATWSPRDPTYPTERTLPANSCSMTMLNCCTRVDLKSRCTPRIVPAGLVALVAVGRGSPSAKRRVGGPPEMPALLTGPNEPMKGAFFMYDCDM